MLTKLETLEQVYALVKDDPVRPHLAADWRMRPGREIYALREDNGNVEAVICVAYCDGIPISEQELDKSSRPNAPVAVFYTVWSYTRGAGTNIIFAVKEHIERSKPDVKRFVTLSPCTEMATRFHLKNGAILLNKYKEYQSYLNSNQK